MYIIIQKDFCSSEKIVNVIYEKNIQLVHQWILKQLEIEKVSHKMCPLRKYIRSVNYNIENFSNEYKLIISYEKLEKGYIYNNYIKQTDYIQFKYFEYDDDKQIDTTLADDNLRILKHLDKDNLYDTVTRLLAIVATKTVWTRDEISVMLGGILKTFRKQVLNKLKKNKTSNIILANCGLESKSKYD